MRSTKRRPPKKPSRLRPLSKFLRSKAFRISLVILAIPALVLAGFLIRYYYVFDGIIAQKLKSRNSLSDTEIYAAPMILYPGKPIRSSDLVATIQRAGYVQGSGSRDLAPASYRVPKASHLLLANDTSVLEDANRAVDITFNNKGIVSIADATTRTNLPRFALKPELLSNVFSKNREKRKFVRYQQFPKVLINAVLASEDRRFFSHKGIDPIRIVRALITDIRAGDTVQGASTLTQQFVKNYFLTPEQTWKRKLSDAYMSILLEQRLPKEEIFELYANEVYLGQRGSFSIVGFGEGANAFFNKDVKDLTLGEAAMLAGIISAPNRFAPFRYPDRAKVRRDLVLNLMAAYEMISPAERDESKTKALEIKPSSILNYSAAPYFVDYIHDMLADKFGDLALVRSNYKVYTSLNLELQQAAFEAIRAGITSLDTHFAKGKRAIPRGTVQASLIALDPKSGQVLAMVGGRNYGTSQFNRITQSKRQPGSIFKPFVYAAALETAYNSPEPLTAVSTVLDEPTQFAFENLVYEPRNFKDEYYGQVTMRQAITKSLNIPTIKFAEKVGYSKITELAHRLGLNEQIKPYPAMAIGAFEVTPLEMARAYTAFANGGPLGELTPIQKILDKRKNLIYAASNKSTKVLTPEVAYMVTSLLESVINNGTGAGVRSLGFSLPAAGKTGTSHDGWFAGYTPDLLCIVWVGFDDNRELNLSGSQSALPIWTEFMKRAIASRPLRSEDFKQPDTIAQVSIDPATGLLATEQCLESRLEYFIKGSEPAIPCYGNSYEQMPSGAGSVYTTSTKDPGLETDSTNGPTEKKRPF